MSPGAVGAGRRYWKGTMQVSLGSLPPPPPKLLLFHLAIGKPCICVATRAWDISSYIEDYSGVLLSGGCESSPSLKFRLPPCV